MHISVQYLNIDMIFSTCTTPSPINRSCRMVQYNVSTKYIHKHCSIGKVEIVSLFLQQTFSEARNVYHMFCFYSCASSLEMLRSEALSFEGPTILLLVRLCPSHCSHETLTGKCQCLGQMQFYGLHGTIMISSICRKSLLIRDQT